MSDSEHRKPGDHLPYIDDSLVINTRLKEIERRQEEEKAEEREYKRRQLRFNRWTVIFTGLLFVTSGVSDLLLLRQLSLNRESADAARDAASAAKVAADSSKDMAAGVRRQNEMIQQQLKGTSAPHVVFDVGVSNGDLTIDATNNGRLQSPHVAMKVTVTVIGLPAKNILRPPVSYSIGPEALQGIDNSNGGFAGSVREVHPIDGFGHDGWEASGRLEKTVKVYWSASWDDGFGDTYPAGKCGILLATTFASRPDGITPQGFGLVPCADFDVEFRKAVISRRNAQNQADQTKR